MLNNCKFQDLEWCGGFNNTASSWCQMWGSSSVAEAEVYATTTGFI